MAIEMYTNEQLPQALALADPEAVVEQASRAAKALTKVVEQAKLSITIGPSKHLKFEAWQTVGRFYDLSPIIESVEHINDDVSWGYLAHAAVINTRSGIKVGGAEALCLEAEKNWKGKDAFQIMSMAQTRAMAKALRSVLSFVVVLAGYEATPAEEITHETSERPPQPRQTVPITQGGGSVSRAQTDFVCLECGYEGLTRYDNKDGSVVYAHKDGATWHRFTMDDNEVLVPIN